MKVAVMQPYIFPYIGYFQLIASVDKFVVFDDVNYINKGWINRNNILAGNAPSLFTIPLVQASQNKLINEIEVNQEEKWKTKLLKSLQHGYGKAPHYKEVYPLLESIILCKEINLSAYIVNSLLELKKYLGISTEIVSSSSIYNNKELKAQYRILDICKKEKASDYHNPIGGLELYSKDVFSSENISLHFIKSRKVPYKQYNNEFIPWLSIIDILMFNSVEEVNSLLKEYDLV